MAEGQRGSVSVLKSIETLFRIGSVGAMTDAELIGLFLARVEGAEAAFEALVRRHGPTVFGVCRWILSDPNDAEDAFQATFLILARRASSVRRKSSIGSWLHGVARRVAMRARAEAIRRRLHETRASGRNPQHENFDDPLPDLARILHEELGRLPEKYRAPVLLCDAEGLTHESAAQRLGWPVGTVSGRLSRAHRLLRDRLRRRGVEPSSIAVGTLVVPSVLAGTTVRAAVPFASKGIIHGAAGTVSAGVIALAEGTLKMMSITRTIVAGAIVMAGVGIATTGVGVLAVRGQGAGDKPKAEAAKGEPVTAPKASETRQTAVMEGVPLDRTTEYPEFAVKFVTEPQGQVNPSSEVLKAIREAAKAAETIPGAEAKATMLVSVAEAYAKAGDPNSAKASYQAAIRVVEELPRAVLKEDFVGGGRGRLDKSRQSIVNNIMQMAAESQANAGFIEDAAETIKKSRHVPSRNNCLVEFAKALAQADKFTEALRLAEDIKDFDGRDTKTSLLAEIAQIQSKDFPKSDRAWIDKLTDPAVKSRVLLGVAAGLSGQDYQPSQYHRPKAR